MAHLTCTEHGRRVSVLECGRCPDVWPDVVVRHHDTDGTECLTATVRIAGNVLTREEVHLSGRGQGADWRITGKPPPL
jgi:hypothetical protein